MKVLMISTDRKILEAGSPVAGRMREYADAFGELHIIVFSTRKVESKTQNIKISGNCLAYPTDSRSKLLYIFDAVRIGSQMLKASRSTLNDWVITTQDPFETGIVGLSLAKKLSLRLNVQVHTDFLSPYFTRGSLLNRIRRLIAGYVLPKASSVRVVSERIRKSLPHIPNITVLPIYSGVVSLPTPTSDRFPRFEKTVLMTCRLEPEKDIDSALRAFAIAEKSVKGIGLVIAGSGSEEATLATLAQSLGIVDTVVFLGWRDAHDLALMRASSDVFLSTSLYEGYGLSLVEAARVGLPIVSTDAGIAPELLPKDRLARPGDVDGIARLLVEALSHSERFMASAEGLARVTSASKEEYLKRLKESLFA